MGAGVDMDRAIDGAYGAGTLPGRDLDRAVDLVDVAALRHAQAGQAEGECGEHKAREV